MKVNKEHKSKPYAIDDTSIDLYYQTLEPSKITEDIEIMRIASVKELYELIASDCQHYISIIANYQQENLQNLFNIIVRRIEGHLLVKFRFNTNDRWVEVGFFDDNNTDKETLIELKNVIQYYLKTYDDKNRNRREQLAAHFDDLDSPMTLTDKHSPHNIQDESRSAFEKQVAFEKQIDFKNQVEKQNHLYENINKLIALLCDFPDNRIYIYQSMIELIRQQDPAVICNVILGLMWMKPSNA